MELVHKADLACRILAPTLHAADLVYFNLETPLSENASMDGMNRTPEKFAATLRSVGTSLVSVANGTTFTIAGPPRSNFLESIRSRSAGLDTAMKLHEDEGIISISPQRITGLFSRVLIFI